MYLKHRVAPSPPAKLNAIDVSKDGLQQGETFKLVQTNDPYAKKLEGDNFVYRGIMIFGNTNTTDHSKLPLAKTATYFEATGRSTNNGFVFLDTSMEEAWAKNISNNNESLADKIIKNVWVYKLQDETANKDKGKYLYVASAFDLLHYVDPNFKVPKNTRYYQYNWK
ncbi:hypothetical protein AAC03nite_38260 [Alicyclobacillus acidoterrestris]|nr:hypothetical protein AAC03nite_38260 [Alicyclobacillus acidoterrestris]